MKIKTTASDLGTLFRSVQRIRSLNSNASQAPALRKKIAAMSAGELEALGRAARQCGDILFQLLRELEIELELSIKQES